ncbi:MAG: hypothetical protein HY720_26540 [Planctomycetes bacterium]|nr:hypothetical protein [Planctomycetota bacterium]
MRPEHPLPVPEGTQVTILVPGEVTDYDELRQQALEWLHRGFRLGPRLYRSRDELHER